MLSGNHRCKLPQVEHCARTRCFLPAHRWNKTVMVGDKMLPTCIVRIEGPSITLPPPQARQWKPFSRRARGAYVDGGTRALSFLTWHEAKLLDYLTALDEIHLGGGCQKSYSRLKGTDCTSRLYSRYCMSSRIRWQTDKQAHRDS